MSNGTINLSPVFDDLNNPDTIINHIEGLKQATATEKELKANRFPVEVFPTRIQEIITATNESLNFPFDFIGASILYAVSVAIGNTYRVEVKKGWQENAVIYLALVGRPGTNKSHPLSFAIQPLIEQDKQTYRHYEQQRLEYETIVSLSIKEREQQGYDEPVKPVWQKYLVSDFTPEALTDVHKFNKRGIGVYVDELAGWYKNFNWYNKSSEQEFWSSIWSGKPVNIDRKNGEPVFIPLPFISVVGTIQNSVLNDLAKENRHANGFIDRILFVIPENLQKTYWSESEINPVNIKNWQSIIKNLLNLSVQNDETLNPKPEILRFTPEAKQTLFKWQRELTDLSNKPENEEISGIYSKMEMHAIRFALILEMIRFACGESNKQAIGIESVQGALKLAEYFKNSAIKIHSILTNANPLDKLPADKQNLYNALPEYFTTNEGVEVAESMAISERTFKYFIASRDLFHKQKRGEYEKRF